MKAKNRCRQKIGTYMNVNTYKCAESVEQMKDLFLDFFTLFFMAKTVIQLAICNFDFGQENSLVMSQCVS